MEEFTFEKLKCSIRFVRWDTTITWPFLTFISGLSVLLYADEGGRRWWVESLYKASPVTHGRAITYSRASARHAVYTCDPRAWRKAAKSVRSSGSSSDTYVFKAGLGLYETLSQTKKDQTCSTYGFLFRKVAVLTNFWYTFLATKIFLWDLCPMKVLWSLSWF